MAGSSGRGPMVARVLVRWFARGANTDLVVADLDDDYAATRETRGVIVARARYWRLALGSILSSSVVGRERPGGVTLGLDVLIRDARHAVRALRARPTFALATILTLALGIGANAAIFSALNGVLLRPLPYGEPTRIVNVWQVHREWQRSDVAMFRARAERVPASWPVYREWDNRRRALRQMAAYGSGARLVEGHDSAEWVGAIDATASLAGVLGVAPATGRWFRDDEQTVAVVSRAFAIRWFGDAEAAVGSSIRLTGVPVTVIGVMPPAFYFPSPEFDIWTPLRENRRNGRWSSQSMSVVGRLADGVTIDAAQREMSGTADAIMRDFPDALDAGVRLVSRVDEVAGQTAPTLLFLMAAVSLVLIVATANVAGLLLVRASSRRQELVVRAALGAGRFRLALQMFIEGAVLAASGGAAGLFVLFAAFGWVRSLMPPSMPRLDEVSIDWRVVAFTAVVSAVVALVFGLASAVHALRQTRRTSLQHGGRRSTSRAFGRSALVVGEVAVSLVLATGAALLAQSYLRLGAVERGFDSRGLLTAEVTAPSDTWNDTDRMQRFFADALERVAALPGVTAAGAVSELPFSGGQSSSGFGLVENPTDESQTGWSLVQRATPGYFDVMRIRVLSGRTFGPEDSADASCAMVVNARFARDYFPSGDAVGSTVWHEVGMACRIVGIVDQVRHASLEEEVERKRYTSLAQDSAAQMDIVIRTDADPSTLAAPIREAILAVSPMAVVDDVATMDALVANATALPRFRTLMIGMLAGIAVLLAASGIYAVLSLGVASRTREIGVRMSLGASRSAVLRQVLASGVRLIAPGLAIGFVATAATARLLDRYLFNTPSDSPLTLAVVASAVGLIALAATMVPARRASRVDPVIALRGD